MNRRAFVKSAALAAGQFFSCDWGTTSFRLRRVDGETGQVLAERREASGVRVLSSSCAAGDRAARERTFSKFLCTQLRLLVDGERACLEDASVMISGMASSSVGWRELPYAWLPVGLDGASIVQESFGLRIDDRWQARVHLVSGLRTQDDILRGEETETLGVFADGRHADVAQDGVMVLPGTHSKHVHLHSRKITGFKTYMTGELYDVLSGHSLLRASVQPDQGAGLPSLSVPDSQEAFVAGVRTASDRGLAGSLFQTRVRTVLQGVLPAVNGWFLSGLLIGSELAGLADGGVGQPILLAAPEPLSSAYDLALRTLGLGAGLTVVPPGEMALASVRGHCTLLHEAQRADGLADY